MNSFYSGKAIRVSLSALLLLLLSACNEGTSTKTAYPPIAQLKNATQINSDGKNYIVKFKPQLKDIPLNKYFDMEVDIKGIFGKLITYQLDLEIDAGMKAHNHGMNVRPIITALGNGRFRVEGMLFHMPGKWFINFSIRRGAMSDKAEVNTIITP